MKYKKIQLKQTNLKVQSSTKNSLLDELLLLRNIQSEKDINKFLNPKKEDFISPFAFCDMQKAKDRIFKAIENDETILIWGDFDCDGVTSSAILYKTLKELNAKVEYFIPNRLEHGHGLNSKELIKAITKHQIKLVITVDCGISNTKEISLLKGFKIDTIITDHHSTDADLPEAFCIINPQAKGSIKEDINIQDITSLTYNSGSSIAYKLAMALLENIQNEKLKDELQIIASCGIVADVVPLLGENRSMVTHALNLLNQKKINSHKAIYKLLSKNNENNITSYDIAFNLAPRINAVGRLSSADLSFEFLTTDNEAKIDTIIEKLDNYNKIRQSKCQETYEEIIEYLKNNKQEQNNPAIILINKDWHIGIIGIVASKIVEEFNKPCFLATIDDNNFARCSIRSNNTINIYQILKENEKLFSGFGGHKDAGGFSLNLEENSFEDIKNQLNKTIKSNLDNEKTEDILWADIELQPDDISLDIIDTISKLEPFGQNNEPPLFVMLNVILDDFKTIGKEQNHLRLQISKDGKTFQCVKWNESNVLIPKNSKCDIAFYPKVNSFNDTTSIQLEIVDMYCEQIAIAKKDFKIFDHRKKTGILEQIAQYFKKDKPDITIYAKNPKTKEELSKFRELEENFICNEENRNGIMFFDYPANKNDFLEIIKTIQPKKIHLMNYKIDENIENYIKQINGMIKFCTNKLNGKIDISKFSKTLCVSEDFIQQVFEILDNIGSIKIKDIDEIEYLKPFNYEDFRNDSQFENLIDEFEKIIQFKKTILNCEINELENILQEVI